MNVKQHFGEEESLAGQYEGKCNRIADPNDDLHQDMQAGFQAF